jgi:hypothetical protein
MRMMLPIFFFMLFCSMLPATQAQLDLQNPDDYLQAFMKTRGSLDSTANVVYYWSGEVYSYIPGQKQQRLFLFEGFSVSGTVPVTDGFELLTREAAFYEDPKTGAILESWDDPSTKQKVDVVQIWNDPVNQDITMPPEYKSYTSKALPSTDLGDQIVFYLDVFPFYPSPLPREKYPLYSQSDTYQAAELFQFFVNKQSLLDPKIQSAPVSLSWTRFSPWMPFMQMGEQPGNLLFVCRGKKLENGYTDLPQKLQTYVQKHHPEFSTPPLTFTEPNETSWTYFLKHLKQQK